MTVAYRNQKFFLQIEEESVEISNSELLKTFDINRVAFFLDKCLWSQIERSLKDGDSFPLPSGIGYRIKIHCDQYHAHTKPSCKLATLYVIEEEKEPESIYDNILAQWEKDYGSLNTPQTMDAYTVSGFIQQALKSNSQPTTQGKQR